MPEVLTFKIEDFEGPLDLLLYLVGKNKMNLYDVNIMELIEQYTAAIREMQQDRMEISSEFIDMAAHLVQMKSALLLPRSPEAERMKAELTGRLIEYSACKEVAAQLGSRARDLYTVAREPMPLVGAAEYTRRHDPNWLVQAWFNLMGRSTRKKKPTQEKFEPLVTAPFVSVASRVSHMLRGLLKGSLQKMGQLFSHEESRSTNVATFPTSMPQLVIAKNHLLPSLSPVCLVPASAMTDTWKEMGISSAGASVIWWSWRSQPPMETMKNGKKRICPFSPRNGNIRLP